MVSPSSCQSSFDETQGQEAEPNPTNPSDFIYRDERQEGRENEFVFTP